MFSCITFVCTGDRKAMCVCSLSATELGSHKNYERFMGVKNINLSVMFENRCTFHPISCRAISHLMPLCTRVRHHGVESLSSSSSSSSLLRCKYCLLYT